MSKKDAPAYYDRAMEDDCGYYGHSGDWNDDLAFYDWVLKMGMITIGIAAGILVVGGIAAGVILNHKSKK